MTQVLRETVRITVVSIAGYRVVLRAVNGDGHEIGTWTLIAGDTADIAYVLKLEGVPLSN